MDNVSNTTEPTGQNSEKLQEFLATAQPDERERILRETVRTHATAILNTSINDDSNFLENGLNSLTALELTKTLMNLTGVEIPMVAIVEHPTPADLGHHLAEEFAQAGAH